MTDLPQMSPLNELLGIEVQDLEDGGVELSLEVTGRHQNELGAVHGGILTSLLDGAMGRSVCRALGTGDNCATVELSVQFMSPAEGRLTARGRPTRVGGSIAFCTAELHDANSQLVARAHGTWAIRRAR